MTHICIGNLTIIGSDNGLSSGQHQAIAWTNVGILLIGPLGTNFSEMLFSQNSNIFIQENALQNVVCEMASILSRPQCVNRNALVIKHKNVFETDIYQITLLLIWKSVEVLKSSGDYI